MRILLLTGMIVSSMLLSGCLVRMLEVEKPRTDLELTGNRGCLMGTCKPRASDKKLSRTRKISVVEVELGKHNLEEVKASTIIPEPASTYTFDSVPEAAPWMSETGRMDISEEPVEEVVFDPSVLQKIESPEPAVKEYTEYTVQAGDTLQKISNKFYGTTRNFIKLYEYNKDTIKNKDSLRVGQKIKVPTL
jgi:LysM repeat protein